MRLPDGAYRVTASRVLLGLRESATGATDEALSDGPSPLTFTVREGWKVETLDVSGSLPATFRLEKGGAGFFRLAVCGLRTRAVARRFRRVGGLRHSGGGGGLLRTGVGPSLALTVPILVGGTLVGVMLGLLCAAWRGGAAGPGGARGLDAAE
jgi:hypothetical protein